MDVTVEQPALARALQAAARVVPARFGHPALRAVLLEAAPGRLTLRTADQELAVVATVPAAVGAPGRAAVAARLLAEYAAALPAGTVRLELRGAAGRVAVTGGRFCAALPTLDPDAIPRAPEADADAGAAGGVALDLPAGALRAAIEQVAFAAARDDTRPVFRAVRFACGPDGLTLAASDGFRLARAHVPRTPHHPDGLHPQDQTPQQPHS